jgi:ribosomal protein L12E/L44/L45/RPP1/RPP2
MERAAKDDAIGVIKSKFDKMTSAVLVDYKGMTVESATKLRENFRKAGVEYKVVKNTLVKHALKGSKYDDVLSHALVGMTAVAWSYEDPSAAAKVVKAFRKDGGPEGEKLQIKSRSSWRRCPARTSCAARCSRRFRRRSSSSWRCSRPPRRTSSTSSRPSTAKLAANQTADRSQLQSSTTDLVV